MTYKILSLLFICFLGQNACFDSQNAPNNFSEINRNSSKQYKIDYSLWEILLSEHVSNKGLVDYKGFQKDKQKLYRFTEHLLQNTPQSSWSVNQKKAYLINAYNAFTIQLVIENYPVESIKDIGGFLSNVFKYDFINFNGNLISLDDIEKGMLLPMGDERVHFAVNCASFSCPKLDDKPYLPENLDEHLNQSAENFLSSERNVINENEVKLSKIFKWYKSDFEKDGKTLIDFINQYSKTKLKPDADIEYLDYNWNLNSINNRDNS